MQRVVCFINHPIIEYQNMEEKNTERWKKDIAILRNYIEQEIGTK